MEIANVLRPSPCDDRDSGKVVTVDAKGEDIFMTRHGEPVGYWDGES